MAFLSSLGFVATTLLRQIGETWINVNMASTCQAVTRRSTSTLPVYSFVQQGRVDTAFFTSWQEVKQTQSQVSQFSHVDLIY